MGFSQTISILFVCLWLLACGRSTSTSNQTVIGGKPAKSGEFADTVSIMRGVDSICSGTVIAKRTVLTAAHCVEGADASTLSIFVGENVANATDTSKFDVTTIAIHPQFWQGYLSGNDLATLTVSSDLPVMPTSLALFEDLVRSRARTTLIVGYGATSNDRARSTNGIKNWARAAIQRVSGEELYIGNNSSDTCSGDSGGPAYLESNQSRKIFAITSRGPYPCAQDMDPGIMTLVQAGVCWLSVTADPQNQIWSNACKRLQNGDVLNLSADVLNDARELTLSSHNIRDISILEKAQSLVNVDLSSNQIVDASALLAIPTLRKVDLRNNRITDTNLFQKLKDQGVVVLGMYSQESLMGKTEFQRIASLGLAAGVENRATVLALRDVLTAGNTERKSRDLQLRHVIGLRSRGVQSLTPLAYLDNAETLLLSGNPLLKDVSPLLTLPALKFVDIRGTGVALEDSVQKKILNELRCRGVQILQGAMR